MDFPGAGAGRIVAQGLSSSGGTAVTSSGSINTKGSWAQLVASSSIDAQWLLVQMHLTTASSAWRLVDIGIGAAGSEQVILANLPVDLAGAGVTSLLLPVSIPAGTRIAARSQCTSASAGTDVSVHLIGSALSAGFGGGSVVTLGADTSDSGGTAIDPGGTINTKGAWVEFSASLASPLRGLVLIAGPINNAAPATVEVLLDIGVGAAGSEAVVLPDIRHANNSANLTITPILPVNIPAGSRLAVRSQASITDATDRVMDVILLGVQ